MDGAELRFARELRASLELIIEERSDYLAAGNAEDFADYKQRVGAIAGLRIAIEEIDDIWNRVSGRITERGA